MWHQRSKRYEKVFFYLAVLIQRVLHYLDELQRDKGGDYTGGVLPKGRHHVYDSHEDRGVV